MALYTLANGSTNSNLQTIFNTIQSSDTDSVIQVRFAAGTHTWTGSSSLTIPGTCDEFYIYGDGVESTTIVDNWGSNAIILGINNIPDKFRMYNIFFNTGASFLPKNPAIQLRGTSTHFRVHNLKFRQDGSGGASNQKHFLVGEHIQGVFDQIDSVGAAGGVIVHVDYDYGNGYGDEPWTETQRGTLDNVFVENCLLQAPYNTNAVTNDADHGGCTVIRMNVIDGYSGCETHATVALRSRGSRNLECYGNRFKDTWGIQYSPNYQFCGMFLTNGSGIMHNNYFEDFIQYVAVFRTQRVSAWAYGNGSTPHAWGWAGTTSNWLYGLVNTSGTAVTKISGENWIGGVNQQSWALQADAILRINGVNYTVASVNSGTSVTLTTSAGTQSSVPSWPVTNWDEKSDAATGWLIMDQPGAGAGDLLTGTFGTSPGVVNADRGNIGYTDPNCHPHQAKEPLYFFLNNATGGYTNYIANGYPNHIVENRDFFCDQADAGGGITGGRVGSGNEAAMNAVSSPIVNQGFWRTDLGTWNDNTDPTYYTGQGQLWIYNGSAWEFLYEPAPYPHPEVVADSEPPPVSSGRRTRPGIVRRSF